MKYLLTSSELAKTVGKTVPAISRYFKPHIQAMAGKRAGIPPESVRSYLEPLGLSYDFKVVSHLNLRGGCGKTTASVSLATRAKQYGHNVCILDLDSQASATLTFGITAESDQPVFLDIYDSPKKVSDILIEIEPSLSILPSSLNNGLLDSILAGKLSLIKNAVSNVCQELKNLGFTLVVIDCSPSLSAGVVSTICASDMIVIPVASDVFSRRGLELTIDEIKTICGTFNMPEPKIKILFSKYDGREKISIDSIRDLAQDPELANYLMPCLIRTCSELPKAAKNCETIFGNFKKSSAREDYDIYAREILELDRIELKSKAEVA